MYSLDDIMQDLENYTEILKALAHPIRLGMVKRLIDKGCCNVTTMCIHLGIPQSTVSNYLAKLKNAGVIEGERSGTEINYCVTNPIVKKVIVALFD